MSRRIAAVLDVAVEPVAMSFGALDHRRAVIVEVESNDCAIGYGEGWVNHPHWAAQECVATIQHGIANEILGTELISVRPIVDRLHAKFDRLATQWGARGPLCQAISGVEIAIFDLLGKIDGVSVATTIERDVVSRGYHEEVAHFVDTILGRGTPITSIDDQRRTLTTVLAAYRGIQERRYVAPGELLGENGAA